MEEDGFCECLEEVYEVIESVDVCEFVCDYCLYLFGGKLGEYACGDQNYGF